MGQPQLRLCPSKLHLAAPALCHWQRLLALFGSPSSLSARHTVSIVTETCQLFSLFRPDMVCNSYQ